MEGVGAIPSKAGIALTEVNLKVSITPYGDSRELLVIQIFFAITVKMVAGLERPTAITCHVLSGLQIM